MTRNTLVALLDTLRDQILIAKTAVEEDDHEKAVLALTAAANHVTDAVKELRA